MNRLIRIGKVFFMFGLVITLSSVGYGVHSALALADTSNEILVRWKGPSHGFTTIPVDNVETALATLQTSPLVDHVEPNYTRSIQVFPDDVLADDQYHLQQTSDIDIDAGRAWNISTGSRDIVVAVIDTGVDLDHPDLADNLWTNDNEIAGNGLDDDGNGYIDDRVGWDFVDNDNDPNPTPTAPTWSDSIVVHGTHVAGLIGAEGNNSIGVSGVNWEVTIMPVRVFTDTGSSTISDIYNAVNYAVSNGADVINMSYGGGGYSVFEQEAIEAANDQGVLSVAAAGNAAENLDTTPSYPVCHPYVLGVAATDAFDATTSFTNYGNDCVDVASPGNDILSTVYTNDPTNGFTDDYAYLSGTSMATPIVSGIAALLLSITADLDPATLIDIISESAETIPDKTLGSGRVNVYFAALEAQALDDPNVPHLRAYHKANQRKVISKKTRTADSTPYFVWKEPTSLQPIVGYYVYWGTAKKNPAVFGQLQTKRTFTPVGVYGNEQAYRLRVKALDVDGATSPVGTFKYIVDTKIRPPTIQSLSATDTGLRITWVEPARQHVVGYYIYRAINTSTHYSKYTSLVTERNFIDSNVSAGHTYKYKVRAVDDLGNESALSDKATHTL